MLKTSYIQQKLDEGFSINSYALGRVGEVIGTEDHFVRIKLRGGGEGVTCFDRGDDVDFDRVGAWKLNIVNTADDA